MADPTETTRFRFWRWLIRFIGVIVPRRFRARFRQEWEAELQYREELLTRWDRLNRVAKLELLWRSLGAFRDALWLQQLRWRATTWRTYATFLASRIHLVNHLVSSGNGMVSS